MYVVMGYTGGDELIHSTATPLFASESRKDCETKLVSIHKDHDEWLAANTLPLWAKYAVFYRFDIVKTPF